jgi:hypothetical protein
MQLSNDYLANAEKCEERAREMPPALRREFMRWRDTGASSQKITLSQKQRYPIAMNHPKIRHPKISSLYRPAKNVRWRAFHGKVKLSEVDFRQFRTALTVGVW